MDGAVRVPVSVRNEEGGPRDYRWTATVAGPTGATPREAASGHLSLADGQAGTVAVRVPVACTGTRARVDVSLRGPHRTIGFWLPCDGSRG